MPQCPIGRFAQSVLTRSRPPAPGQMLSFTPREAKRMLGLVNMGGCLASMLNGPLVSLIVTWCPGGASVLLPAQAALLLLQLLPNAMAVPFLSTMDGGAKPATAAEKPAATAKPAAGGDAQPLANRQVALMAWWSLGVSCVFSLVEWQAPRRKTHPCRVGPFPAKPVPARIAPCKLFPSCG